MRPESRDLELVRQRRNVLLPQPLGPMNTTASPRFLFDDDPVQAREWRCMTYARLFTTIILY